MTFYDAKGPCDELGSPISAITGLIGEDLVLGLLRHYLKATHGKEARIVTRCKEAGRRGAWLDAWVIADDICYATEVKNWCASAFGGKPIHPDESNLVEVSHHNLKLYLGKEMNAKQIWKVLREMVRHGDCGELEAKPLLAFWSPVAPTDVKNREALNPFFECPIKPFLASIKFAEVEIPKKLKTVSVFSASLYLRTLNQRKLRVCMPRAIQRLRELENLIEWPR